ncbi:MAG: AmmeMemoRadiSam system protein A [Actinomycetota bacterium]
MSSGVREPVAAGLLYAADPQQLRVEIDAAINAAESEFAGPKLLIVPECGLVAAPDITGSAMLMLESERDHIERVVLIADHVPGIGERSFAGIAVPRGIAFRTPLGDLLVDRDGVEALSGHHSIVINDRPFQSDHRLEVHLPPVQRLLGNVKILPILVGEAPVSVVTDILERVWGGRETLIVVSTHFGVGDDAAELAAQGERIREALRRCEVDTTTQRVVSAPTTLASVASITGRRSMGLIELATDTIDYDGGGLTDMASFGAWESGDISLADPDIRHLRALALSAIHLTVLGGRVDGTDTGRIPPSLVARRACVVTLRREGETRGSAGTIEADRPLAASVVRNAAAACADPRLPSVQPTELDSLDVAISIVSPIQRIFPRTWEELGRSFEVGRHGVLVTTEQGRAAQLPAMWTRFPTPEQFVGAVAAKAGLDAAGKVTDAAWYRFETTDY